MGKTSILKRTQIQGKKYDLPPEDVEIEKLIKKGLGLDLKLKEINRQLNLIKQRMIEIARGRREGTTTVNLKAISGAVTVTFRESYECNDHVEEIRSELGSLFDRFFHKKASFKTTKELKQFLEEGHGHGLENPDEIKTLIFEYVKKKETKPNVKMAPAE